MPKSSASFSLLASSFTSPNSASQSSYTDPLKEHLRAMINLTALNWIFSKSSFWVEVSPKVQSGAAYSSMGLIVERKYVTNSLRVKPK